jgi:hypothetical protein
MPLVFFDTEFTDLCFAPRLISIGLVSEDGRHEFYAELSDTWRAEDASAFCREVVLPLLEGEAVQLGHVELSRQLAEWLNGFAEPVTLVTDSLAWDWPWIQALFPSAASWPRNLAPKPQLLDFPGAAGRVFTETVEGLYAAGLRRHHALDDARANRLGYLAAVAATSGTASPSPEK